MDFTKKAEALVAQMTLEERASQLSFDSPPIERLGIPRYHWWNEALHGVARAGTATMFPQAIAMAAMFDEEMMHQIGDVIATEARGKYNISTAQGDRDIYKGLTLWSPNINIFRDPRWGRGHETYGEDPYLTGRLGVNYIKGMQGDGKYLKAAACAKHFAVHSGPEELRHEFNAEVSDKDLWETYLPAFEECVIEAKVEGVMGAYNRTNGEPCCASQLLMKDILRDKWQFDGYYVSDCWALKDLHENHHVTSTITESVALALKMGCDINCGNLYLRIMQAYQEGKVTEEDINTAAVNALRTRLRLGLLAEDCEYDQIDYEKVACREHRDLAIQASENSVVLLKNEACILPLSKEQKAVAVIGPNADSRMPLIANYHGTAPRYITILEGIEEVSEGKMRIYYSEGCHTVKEKVERLARENDRFAEAIAAAKMAGTAIMCVGLDERYEGEQQDIGNRFEGEASNADKETTKLPEVQVSLLKEIIATGVDVIVVNLTGSAVDLKWLHDTPNVKAILQGWYPGAEGGLAIARVLFGEVNPSGKLPVTFYEDAKGMLPITDYSMKNRTYRYMEGEPLYPFGYGLSYTTFTYKEANVKPNGQGCEVRVQVTNSGQCVGTEIVEVYCKDAKSKHAVRNHSLCAFTRVTLAPNESKEVCLQIPEKAFTIVDETGKRYRDSDSFVLYIGGSQPDARSEALLGSTPLTKEFVFESKAQ